MCVEAMAGFAGHEADLCSEGGRGGCLFAACLHSLVCRCDLHS